MSFPDEDSNTAAILPTPPSSSENQHRKPTPPSEHRAKQCVLFLKALLNMKSIATSSHSQSQSQDCMTEDTKAMIEHTVNRSIQILAEWTQDACMPLSDEMADKVVDTLVTACDCDTDPYIKDCTLGAMCIFIQDLIKTIMDHEALCQVF